MSIYTKPKVSCLLCKKEVSISNLPIHYNSKSCKGNNKPKTVEGDICLFCGENLKNKNKGSHVKWCNENPNRGAGVIGNHGPSKYHTNETRQKISETIKKQHAEGKYKNRKVNLPRRKHTEETKIKMSLKARESKHQRVCKKSHSFTDKKGRSFIFDSSWEDALAIRLDELNLVWERPEPICWTDTQGKKRHYFPDFYLPELNLYLDPKNSYVIEQQKEKLDIIKKQINLIILSSIKDCKEWCPCEESNLMPSTQL